MLTLDDNVSELDLQVRPVRALIAEGIYTIRQLLPLGDRELLKIPNLGRLSLIGIRDALNKHPYLNELQVKEEKKIKSYALENSELIKEIKNMLSDFAINNENKISQMFFEQVNEIRTLVIEQQRILEGIQSMNRPDGILHKIEERIPGFRNMVYEIYRNTE